MCVAVVIIPVILWWGCSKKLIILSSFRSVRRRWLACILARSESDPSFVLGAIEQTDPRVVGAVDYIKARVSASQAH